MWFVLIPVVGIVAVAALWPKAKEKPSEGVTPGVTATFGTKALPGSAAAAIYMQRMDAALAAYRAVKLIGGSAAASALATLKGTLDVVPTLAAKDVASGKITQGEMAAISAKADEIKAQIT